MDRTLEWEEKALNLARIEDNSNDGRGQEAGYKGIFF